MNFLASLLLYETPAYKSFTIFGLEIYYYAVCIVLAIAVATCLTMLLMHRKNISYDIVLVGFIICVPSAIVGARLYACISEADLGIQNFFEFRNGGMSIMGSLIGGVIAALIYCYVKKYNFLRMTDCVLPTVPLAQAIGRWGNYFNQEVYGRVVENPSLQFFPISVFIEADGQWHYSFFLYEGVLNAIWFAVLFTIAWKLVKKPNGFVTGLFCLFYGIIRAIMEPLRDTQFQYGNGVSIDPSLVSSYLLIVIGAGLIAFVLIYNYKKEGKIFGSARGDEYTVTNFVPSEKGELPLYTSINAATKLRKEGKIKV
jgi:phosphatidylglycerol:prolipoprotein diacylglycerol transferase